MVDTVPFKPENMVGEDEIAVLEYFLQLSFFTTDLHITNSWTFCSKEQLEAFKNHSKQMFGGSLVSFWSDLNKLEPPQSFENCVNSGLLNLDYKKQLFEYGTIAPPSGFQGNPTGTFTMLLFKVSLGRVYSFTPETKSFQDDFLKFKIPEEYHSVELVTNNEPKRYNSLYRVSDSSQVLLYAAVEFEFTPLKVQVLDSVCEMCESAMAKWYCHSDRAHFCNNCDTKQHSSTRIFSRHIRIPCSKSPNQFGLCEQHPTEVVEMVCLKCCSLLCNNCILFGKHSQPSFFDHPLMSTLDTYELSLEKNSDSDEKLKFRRNQVSEKIKNRHNLTSQIYANSKGVETKIDYCNKLLLQQLGEMKAKKLKYLNSIEREVSTQLKMIEWMQSFLNHLLLSLEPCQFIMFKKRYDLLVQKYFTKDLKDYLEFPVWMNKQLTLIGDTKITCTSIRNLTRSFSTAPGTTFIRGLSRVDLQDVDKKEKLLDWTPLNMYENLNETVRRVGHTGGPTENTETDKKSVGVYGDVGGATLVKEPPQKTVHEYDVIDTATKLWHYLSDFKMGTLIQLLKLVEVHERGTLVKHIFNLANHFEQLGPLFTHVSNYEMNGLANDFGYCVLLRSSGVLGDVLSFLFCSNSSTKDNSDFLKQLTSPVDHHFDLYLNSSSTDPDAVDTLLAESVDNCMVEIVAKLVALDLLSFPSSLQYVVYGLADLFNKLKFEYQCYVVVDLFCTLLSNYVLRYLNQQGVNGLLFNTKPDPEDTDSTVKYNKLKTFTRELSFKFARAAIVVWELDSLTQKDSDELRQAQKMYDWCAKLLVRPRMKCKLSLKTPSSEELNDSCNYVLTQVSKFEKRLNSGLLDIPYKHASELTSKYNFLHLFKMAHQIPT